MSGDDKKRLFIFCNPREKDSWLQLFNELILLSEDEIKERFPRLLPHNIGDIKDSLNKTKF